MPPMFRRVPIVRGRAPWISGLLLALLLHATQATGLSFGGRFGVELEGLGEEFQT